MGLNFNPTNQPTSTPCGLPKSTMPCCGTFKDNSHQVQFNLKFPIVNRQMTGRENAPWEFPTILLDAAQRIGRYLSNRYLKYGKAGSKLWNFDLGQKKWRVVRIFH